MAPRAGVQVAALVGLAVAAAIVARVVNPVLDWGGNDLELVRHGVARIDVDEAAALRDDVAALFLDARPAAAFGQGHVPGAVAFPAEDLDSAYEALRDFLDADMRLIVYGDAPQPAVRAARYLGARGFTARVLEGGWEAWVRAGLPQSQEEP